jgi:hypothetical protein
MAASKEAACALCRGCRPFLLAQLQIGRRKAQAVLLGRTVQYHTQPQIEMHHSLNAGEVTVWRYIIRYFVRRRTPVPGFSGPCVCECRPCASCHRSSMSPKSSSFQKLAKPSACHAANARENNPNTYCAAIFQKTFSFSDSIWYGDLSIAIFCWIG